MTTATHEHTLNIALGEVLSLLRQSWTTRSERTGQVLKGGGRPDILIEEASGWPVVIEAERTNYASAEDDAQARLGCQVARTGRFVETAIALVYPSVLHSLDGPELREAMKSTAELEFALYTRNLEGVPDRLPSRGWITGGVRDLAMLVHRAAVPPPRIEALASELEDGVRHAAEDFTRRHAYGSQLGTQIADVLGQSDDCNGQTRRMAMTVIGNALVFHESLAEAEFQIQDAVGGLVAMSDQSIRSRRETSSHLAFFVRSGSASFLSTIGQFFGPQKKFCARCQLQPLTAFSLCCGRLARNSSQAVLPVPTTLQERYSKGLSPTVISSRRTTLDQKRQHCWRHSRYLQTDLRAAQTGPTRKLWLMSK